MNAVYPFQKSLRCKATSKRTGKPCQAPAVTGWAVCRFHGAKGGAPKGQKNGAYRHGRFTKEAKEVSQSVSLLLRLSRKTLLDTFR